MQIKYKVHTVWKCTRNNKRLGFGTEFKTKKSAILFIKKEKARRSALFPDENAKFILEKTTTKKLKWV